MVGYLKVLNLLRYITFRTGAAFLTALLMSFVLGPRLISWLKKMQVNGQPIRDDGPASHLITKVGTPTMGGVLILISLVSSVILWSDLTNPIVWSILIVLLGFGAIGAADDFLKLSRRHNRGLTGRHKLLLQIMITSLFLLAQYKLLPSYTHDISFPFTKGVMLNIGFLFPIWATIVIVGASNAVNLTDGLDGLAIGPIIIASCCFAIICYVVGNIKFSDYLHIFYVANAGELSVFFGALIGSGLGFLWYNAPPARIFMGDTGSLAIGGAIGAIAVTIKHEIVLAIIGGLFVIEALSVIIQVGYFKMTRRRIFLMAPIHHHFEKKGWSEPTIVIRFWIIAAILGLIGLSSLKIR